MSAYVFRFYLQKMLQAIYHFNPVLFQVLNICWQYAGFEGRSPVGVVLAYCDHAAAAAGLQHLDPLCHSHHLHVGCLPVGVSRGQNWVTAAEVGCPAWAVGSATDGSSANILKVKPWKLFRSSGKAALLFCLTLTGRINATPSPSALLS